MLFQVCQRLLQTLCPASHRSIRTILAIRPGTISNHLGLVTPFSRNRQVSLNALEVNVTSFRDFHLGLIFENVGSSTENHVDGLG